MTSQKIFRIVSAYNWIKVQLVIKLAMYIIQLMNIFVRVHSAKDKLVAYYSGFKHQIWLNETSIPFLKQIPHKL